MRGILPIIACFSWGSGALAEPIVLTAEDIGRAIHPNLELAGTPIEPAFEDYAFMMFDICDALELECLIYPMMGNIENAMATIKDGNPIIVYDRRLNSLIFGDGAEAVIAHELGHHVCAHLTDTEGKSAHQIEKEADRFMGFAMKKMGRKLSDLVETYERLGIDKASATHPSLAERTVAIAEGYAASSLKDVCPDIDLVGDQP